MTDPATAYTVLAPDNSAITEALSALEIDVNTFLADESLSSILAYHFIPEVALVCIPISQNPCPSKVLLSGSTAFC